MQKTYTKSNQVLDRPDPTRKADWNSHVPPRSVYRRSDGRHWFSTGNGSNFRIPTHHVVESIIPGQPCPVPSPTLSVFVLWFLYFSLKNLGKAGLDMKDLIEKVTQKGILGQQRKGPKGPNHMARNSKLCRIQKEMSLMTNSTSSPNQLPTHQHGGIEL